MSDRLDYDDEHCQQLARDDLLAERDEYAGRLESAACWQLARAGGTTWSEWLECDPRLEAEPALPTWADNLPGLDAGPVAYLDHLAEQDDIPAELEAVLDRMRSALGVAAPTNPERFTFALEIAVFRAAAVTAVPFYKLPTEALRLRDEDFEWLYGSECEYASDLEAEFLEAAAEALEAAAAELLKVAAAATTTTEAADLLETAQRAELLAADLRHAAADHRRRAARARHPRTPLPRPRRCTLRGTPAPVVRQPAAPHGPPTRAPRDRMAVLATA